MPQSAAARRVIVAAAALVWCLTMAVTERIIVAAGRPGDAHSVNSSPFVFPVTGEDNLRLTVTSAIDVVVGVHLRFADGTTNSILAYAETFQCAGDRVTRTTTFSLGNGSVINLTTFCTLGAPVMGQTFITIDVIRGLGGATIALGTMVQGYITARQPRGWPGSPIQQTTDVDGFLTAYDGAPLPAGNVAVIPCPANTHWTVLNAGITLVSLAGAAVRRPFFELRSNGTTRYNARHLRTQTGAAADDYYWAAGLTGNVDTSASPTTCALSPMTELIFPDDVTLNVLNMDPTDRIMSYRLEVLERLQVA